MVIVDGVYIARRIYFFKRFMEEKRRERIQCAARDDGFNDGYIFTFGLLFSVGLPVSTLVILLTCHYLIFGHAYCRSIAI